MSRCRSRTGACSRSTTSRRYAITAGSRIIVDAAPEVPARNVRLFLLGSAMGMLIHQRGLLPLHANAVEIDGRAVAFMGRSGAGKSTLAAWFHDQRLSRARATTCAWCASTPTAARWLSAGMPRLRLWRDAVERAGATPGTMPRSYAGDESFDKYDVPVAAADARGDGDAAAGRGLSAGPRARRCAITGWAGWSSVEALFANTYRGAFVADTAGHRVHWQACVDLAGRVPIFGLQRQWGEERIDAGNAAVLAHARGLGSGNA